MEKEVSSLGKGSKGAKKDTVYKEDKFNAGVS